MPYTGEILIIIACLVWGLWYYDYRIEIEFIRSNEPKDIEPPPPGTV